MRQTSCFWMLMLIFFTIACGDDTDNEDTTPVDGGNTEAEQDSETDSSGNRRFADLIDSIEEEMTAYGASGAAVAVIEDDRVTFARGFGTVAPDSDQEVADTTLFRNGSNSKMLTALGVLRLVDSGKVALDDPIEKYLPELRFEIDPTWSSQITVHQLLTHASGIVDIVNTFADSELQGDDALESYLYGDFLSEAYVMAPPGRMYNYSNPNYALLGLIAETQSGEYYNTYMRENVFEPLGMHRTFFHPDDVTDDGDFAGGITTHPETGKRLIAGPDTYDNAGLRPAGFGWTSVNDLAKAMLFLAQGDGDFLSDDLRKKMTGPQINMETFLDNSHYGYGLFVKRGIALGPDAYYDLQYFEHSGDIRGYSTDFYYIPEIKFGFISMANADNAHLNRSLVTALDTLADFPEKAERPDISMAPNRYDAFEGTYYDPFMLGEFTVVKKDDDLTIDIPNAQLYDIDYDPVLSPLTPNNFYVSFDDTVLEVTFIFDDTGENVEYFRTRLMVAEKIA